MVMWSRNSDILRFEAILVSMRNEWIHRHIGLCLCIVLTETHLWVARDAISYDFISFPSIKK